MRLACGSNQRRRNAQTTLLLENPSTATAQSCPQTVPQVSVTVVRLPHRLTPSATKPITAEHVSAAPMLRNSKFHQRPEVVLWTPLSTVADDEMWPHSGDKRKLILKKGVYFISKTLFASSFELTLQQENIWCIVSYLWNYRTDCHCSSSWRSLLTGGSVRTIPHGRCRNVAMSRKRHLLSSWVDSGMLSWSQTDVS